MKFGSYWEGEWPWCSSMGVGLRLTGRPRNDDELRTFLYSMSCNPVAAERIIRELHATGVKLTTVQASLNFAHIGDELGRLGVRMEVVEPIPPEQVNDSVADWAALRLSLGRSLPTGLTEEQTEEAIARARETGALDPEKLGPYRNA